ncbi:hypothetical protein MuYL_3172 [Mucilaginibacter xinganensis]|uniref:Uncharacterized protein n=1 Tax=Mucilaginibacter xinganensis TaxID=1234841 RepID=A0A223NYU6_9SPHI|nr:hypothetical protein MuYL_3172 [Mucilaginibacter xinganensis]
MHIKCKYLILITLFIKLFTKSALKVRFNEIHKCIYVNASIPQKQGKLSN